MADITSVSMHIFVCASGHIPPTHVLLQRRGFHNFEKKGKPESWPNGLQPAAHVELRPGEEGPYQIDKDLEYKLGKEFCGFIESAQYLEPILINGVAYYSFEAVEELIPRIRLRPSSGGILLITPEDFDRIQDLHNFPKDQPVPSNVLAMFPNDKEAMIQHWERMTTI